MSMTILKAEQSVQRLFKKARCDSDVGTETKAVDTERRTKTGAVVRTLRRKTSQDDVTGYGRRKEKEESITTS